MQQGHMRVQAAEHSHVALHPAEVSSLADSQQSSILSPPDDTCVHSHMHSLAVLTSYDAAQEPDLSIRQLQGPSVRCAHIGAACT